MHQKWFLRAFILLLTVAGIHLHTHKEPNQELVVQFSAQYSSNDQAQEAITIVKKQLHQLGIDAVKVQAISKEGITFTYYSELDISSIKSTLSLEQLLDLESTLPALPQNNSENPLEQNQSVFTVNIYEIQQSNDLQAGFDGFVIEIDAKSQRFSIPNGYGYPPTIALYKRPHAQTATYKQFQELARSINDGECTVPEVRAGPIA